MGETNDFLDPYEATLYLTVTSSKVIAIQELIQNWDQATYPSIPTSVVKHANKHGFRDKYLRYLCKARNFSKKGSRKKYLPKNIFLMVQQDGIRAMNF